jgi:ubiquinone biosynthesis protein
LIIPREAIALRRARWPLAILNACLPKPAESRGIRLRHALTELGPVYIKLGQLLSTRRDLLPADIADELAFLQDQVPPIVDFDVHAFLSEVYGVPVSEVFASLDAAPLASASIAQVHTAKLADGEDVVVKIVRPNIEPVIRADMSLLRDLAERIERWIPDALRLHLPEITRDHERVLLAELNMHAEARNQVQLRRNFAESPLLYVPRVHTRLTRQNVLVMERIYGVPINRIDELERLGVDLERLAYKGVETFFTQVFEHNFFHADMHPGNIYIDVSDPADPHYIALDCAIIGSLTDADQTYLAQNLLAFFTRDYRRIVELHLESGWVPATTDAAEFERVIRQVCEPIFAKPLNEISFGEFVVELFRTAGQFNMEIQPQLVLLQKTLLYIEGLGRQLYPALDLWETAQPFIRRWVAERFGPTAILRDTLAKGPEFWTELLRTPTTLSNNAAVLRAVQQTVGEQRRSIEHIEKRLAKRDNSRRLRQGTGATLMVISAWLLWQPIAAGLGGGDVTMLAGVVSALMGSALIIRA